MSEPARWSASHVAQFRERGFVVAPPLFDAATLDPVARELERVWSEARAQAAATRDAGRIGFAHARPELQRLHLRSPILSAFCRHRVFAELALALLGDDADVFYNQAYAKGPGGDGRGEIPWHQDAWYAEIDRAAYNCWVAITPTTVANGTLRFAPAPDGGALLAHRWDDALEFYRCDVDERAATPVELARGQAFVYSGRVPHASGVNGSPGARLAYSVSFCAAGARLCKNGEAFGDRIPIARAGRPAADWLVEHARSEAGAADAGARLIAEIAARAPGGAGEVETRFGRYCALVGRGAAEAADTELGRLLALVPDDVEVRGDLVRARTRVDQLLDEYARVRSGDPAGARLLLERILELDPQNLFAARELGRG